MDRWIERWKKTDGKMEKMDSWIGRYMERWVDRSIDGKTGRHRCMDYRSINI